MERIRKAVPIAGFALSLLAVGVPYWMIAYREIGLPHTLLGPALSIVVLAAAASCALRAAPFWKTVWIIGASVPAAVMLRVGVECAIDPTSHNLWPLEAIIALAIGFACALPGAISGTLAAMYLPTRSRSRS